MIALWRVGTGLQPGEIVQTQGLLRVGWSWQIAGVAMLVLVFAASVEAGSARAADPVSGDPVIVAAGDIACSPHDPHFNGGVGAPTLCKQRATSNIFVGDTTVNRVLALGDLQYECAAYSDFLASYAPSWGRAKTITRPALGNHEYITGRDPFGVSCPGGGGGYFRYFAASPSVNVARPGGYYSWNIGSWHMVVLNSNCKFVSCTATGTQATWLKNDLAASNARCTLAYWHHPRFNGKSKGPTGSMAAMWNLLEAEGAEVILNGHKHAYARFAPLTSNGVIDRAHGIRQFIVGTGGENIGVIPNQLAMIEKTDPGRHFGVLRMTLHPHSYDYKMVATNGATVDSGTTPCH